MAIIPELQQLIEQMTKECERLTMKEVQVYDVKGSSPVTDAVLIATADHILQLDAARRSLSFMAKQAGYTVQNPTEDYSDGWLAMDCSDLVIHILVEEKRAFYDLDGLMDSIVNSRSLALGDRDPDHDEEKVEQELTEILAQLTPEEAEELLNNLEQEDE